jgi:hypothetical protein
MILASIALALSVVAFFLRDMTKGEPSDEKHPSPALAYGLLAILVGLAVFGGTLWKDYLGAAVGFGIGALAAALSYAVGLMSNQSKAGRAMPIALGTLGVALLPIVPLETSPLAAIFGSAAAAWLLSFNRDKEPNYWGVRCALTIAGVAGVNALGAFGAREEIARSGGVLFGILISFVAIVSSLAPRIRPFLATGLVAAGSWVLVDRVLLIPDALIVTLAASLLAVIVHFMLNEDNGNSLRQLVAVIIWVAAGSALFNYEQGYGVALIFLIGMGLLLTYGNQPALASLGPLGAIVLYRVFRENHIEATRAYDIGQHYAMVGILVGMALPVLAQEWQRVSAGRTKFFGGIAGAIWIPAMLVVPVGAAVLLGAKGVVGYLFGLGLAPVVESLRGDKTSHPASLALGLSAAMTLMFTPIQPLLELDRDGKLRALGFIVGGLAVLGLTIAVLSGEFARPKAEKQSS